MEQELLRMLVEKYPAMDPAWSAEERAAWFEGYGRLLDLVQGGELRMVQATLAALTTPSAPSTNGDGPATNGKGGGSTVRAKPHRATPEQMAILERLAAAGAKRRQIALETGLPPATITYHLHRLRVEASAKIQEPEREAA